MRRSGRHLVGALLVLSASVGVHDAMAAGKLSDSTATAQRQGRAEITNSPGATLVVVQPSDSSSARVDAGIQPLPLGAVNVAFAVLPLLFGILLQSPVKRSQEIIRKLLNYRLTFVTDSAIGDVREAQRTELKGQIDGLHHLFDENALAYREYVRLRGLLFKVLLVLFIAIALSLVNYVAPPKWVPTPLSLGLLVVIALEGFVLYGIGSVYMVPPDKLQSVDYLVNELDLDVPRLVAAANLNISVNPLRLPQDRHTPLSLTLNTDVRMWGYRFLCVLFNESGEVYFASYGPLGAARDTFRHPLPPTIIPGRDELVTATLGSADLNAIDKRQELSVLLIVFMAVYTDLDLLPFFSRGTFQVFGAGADNYMIGSGLGGFDVDSERPYDGIRYRGSGLKLTKLRCTPSADDAVRRVVEKYSRGIRRSRRTVTHFDPTGKVC